MSHNVKLNSEKERMEYYDDEGNPLYRDDESGLGKLLPPSRKKDKGGSTGFDPHKPIPIVVHTGGVGGEKTIRYSVKGNGPEEAPTLEEKEVIEEEEVKPTEDEEEQELMQEIQEAEKSFIAPSPVKAAVRSEESLKPEAPISFHLPGGFGDFECFYHRIFRDGMYLVLVWDRGYQGNRYIPPSKLDISTPLEVTVGSGAEKDSYKVYIGPKFIDEHRNEEYIIFLIDGE